jgi:hypothetical protein
MFAYPIGDLQADLVRDDRDNAASIPKSVVIEQAFTWGAIDYCRRLGRGQLSMRYM